MAGSNRDHEQLDPSENSGLPQTLAFDGASDDPSSDKVDQPFDASQPRRVLFVSSSGGHLSQLLQLRDWWSHHDRQWVTFDLPDARSKLDGETLIPAHHPTTRNIKNLLRNVPLAIRVLRRFRPDVVISNGAGVALPFFVVARMMGTPTVYLEVYDRIDSRTMTGRLCAPFASLFLVQWPEQQTLYPGSVLVGPLY